MTKATNSVLLGTDHKEKTAQLLDAYSANVCAYFSDFHALLGSTVAMRKSLELMGAYFLLHFSKKKILVQSGHDVFHGRYSLDPRTASLFIRMQAIVRGSQSNVSGQRIPGIGSILHYQGYRAADNMPCRIYDQQTLYDANKLFIVYFPEYQDILRSFCELAQINTSEYSGLKMAEDLLCDAPLTTPILFNVESQLGITFEESQEAGWLEWYSRILLYYDNNENHDELLVDHTIAACCRSIAEKTMFDRICGIRPDYAKEASHKTNYSLKDFIEDYRNSSTSSEPLAQEEKRKDLSRAVTIRNYTNATLHWSDRPLQSSLLRFEDLHESKALFIDRQKVVQCSSELIRSIVLENQPTSVRRLIERYYDRVPGLYREMEALLQENEELRRRIKAAKDEAKDETNEEYDIFDQLQTRFDELFGKASHSWIAKKKFLSHTEITQIRLKPATNPLAFPACRIDTRRAIKSLHSISIHDALDSKTLVFQIKNMLLEASHESIYYLKPAPGIEEFLTDSISRKYEIEFSLSNEDFDHAAENLVLLTLMPTQAYLNSGIVRITHEHTPKLYVGQKGDLISYTMSWDKPEEISALNELGLSLNVDIAPVSPNNPSVKEYLSAYSPQKLSYVLIDTTDSSIVTPQVFRNEKNEIMIRQTLLPYRNYIALQVQGDDFDTEAERTADLHHTFGNAYCTGDKQLRKDYEAAADEYHAGFEIDPNDKRCCYGLGCIFRYVDELKSDEDAYEYLGISARRGLPEARYEWAKLVLSNHYPVDDKRLAVHYMLELYQCGYRTCGKEKLEVYLPIILPMAETHLQNLVPEQNESDFWFAADLAYVYCSIGRLNDAEQLWKRILAVRSEHISVISLMERLERILWEQHLYAENDQVRRHIRALRQEVPLITSLEEATATLKALEALEDELDSQNRYRDQVDILQQIYDLRCAWPLGTDSESVSILHRLAFFHSYLGNHEVSYQLGLKVFDARQSDPSISPGLRITTLANLNFYSHEIGKLDQILEKQRQVVKWRSQEYGANDPSTLKARRRLAFYHSSLGHFDDAATILNELLDLHIKEDGENTRAALIVQAYIARNLQFSGQAEESLELYSALLPRMREHLGIDDEQTLECAIEEAQLLYKFRRKHELLASLESLLPIMQCAFGSDSPRTVALMELSIRAHALPD